MKPKQAQNLSLFEAAEALSEPPKSETCSPASRSSSPTPQASTDPTACPKCGGRSQLSVRPAEMGGTRYCPVCQGEDGCYYFTPGVSVSPGQEIVREAFDDAAADPKQTVLREIDKELGINVASDETTVDEIPWKEYIRMVQLFFNKEGFEEFDKLLNRLSASYKTNNPTDTIVEAMRREKNRLDF